jgi:hypothetical protein
MKIFIDESQKYNQETEFSFALDDAFQEQWLIKNIFKYCKQMRQREQQICVHGKQ